MERRLHQRRFLFRFRRGSRGTQPGEKPPTFCNARMTEREVREHCRLSCTSETMLKHAMDRMTLSARAYMRILKVARTIADLDGSPDVGEAHLGEAIQYRHLDRPLLESM